MRGAVKEGSLQPPNRNRIPRRASPPKKRQRPYKNPLATKGVDWHTRAQSQLKITCLICKTGSTPTSASVCSAPPASWIVKPLRFDANVNPPSLCTGV